MPYSWYISTATYYSTSNTSIILALLNGDSSSRVSQYGENASSLGLARSLGIFFTTFVCDHGELLAWNLNFLMFKMEINPRSLQVREQQVSACGARHMEGSSHQGLHSLLTLQSWLVEDGKNLLWNENEANKINLH